MTNVPLTWFCVSSRAAGSLRSISEKSTLANALRAAPAAAAVAAATAAASYTNKTHGQSQGHLFKDNLFKGPMGMKLTRSRSCVQRSM